MFETDQFQPLIDLGQELSGRGGDHDRIDGGEGDPALDRALRILADHARGMSFLIADGVVPSNEDRGYVLRRLTRRAILQGRRLEMAPGFLLRYAAVVRELMAGAYPELLDQRDPIERWLSSEEDAFGRTLEQGTGLLDELIERALHAGDTAIAAPDAFALHDTYGFPVDLTRELAAERGLTVDEHGFERLMDAQRARSRAGVGGQLGVAGDLTPRLESREGAARRIGNGGSDPRLRARELAASAGFSTRFTGYETETQPTSVGAVWDTADESGGRLLVKLAESPFYPAGGGQVSDTGTIECVAAGDGDDAAAAPAWRA